MTDAFRRRNRSELLLRIVVATLLPVGVSVVYLRMSEREGTATRYLLFFPPSLRSFAGLESLLKPLALGAQYRLEACRPAAS